MSSNANYKQALLKTSAVRSEPYDRTDDQPLDHNFMCSICFDCPAQIPTALRCPNKSMPYKCAGNAIVCLSCAREHCGCSTPRESRSDEYVKCLNCRSPIVLFKEANAKNSYDILRHMFPIIDDKYGEKAAKCKRCSQQCTTQGQLWIHKLEKCPYSNIKCPKCEHWCYRKDIEQHIREEHTTTKCPICYDHVKNILLRPHLLDHQEEHRKRLIDLRKAQINITKELTKTFLRGERLRTLLDETDVTQGIGKFLAEEDLQPEKN